MPRLTTAITHYTLVQHSGFGYGDKPGFEHAVEPRSVTPAEERKVLALGGAIFESYSAASDAEHAENFPPEVEGMYPRARGTFAKTKIDGLRIYLPARTLVPA